MRILLDTNILTRSFQPGHEHHQAAVDAVRILRGREDSLFVAPQNLFEFWVVATRPAGDNGLGLQPSRTLELLERIERAYTLLVDSKELLSRWKKLVVEHSVLGKSAHDARLVAAAKEAQLDAVLTFNGRHFQRYKKPAVLHPDELNATD